MRQYSVIQVEGADRYSFLQGQLTCDLRDFSSTHSIRGAHCNLKGRVEAIYRLREEEDAIFLETPADVAEHALKHLMHYARFSKIKLEEVASIEEDSIQCWEDIGAGRLCLHPNTVGCYLPQELRLIEEGAVSLRKGCYLGQEIVARLHYLGQLKRQLRLLTLEHPVMPSEKLSTPEGQHVEVVDAFTHGPLTRAWVLGSFLEKQA